MNQSHVHHSNGRPDQPVRSSRRRQSRHRRGATMVEFAVVAPVFIVATFFCFDMGRVWMDTSFIEQAAFEVARDISVLGARIDEARPVAQQELSIIGVDEFTLDVRALQGTAQQAEITDNSTAIEVTIEVPLNELSFLSSFFAQRNIRRTAFIKTNRP